MAKKILSDEDSALFRQTIGKVTVIEQDTVLLSPKVTIKSPPNKTDHFLQKTTAVIEQLRAEDHLSFLVSGLHKKVLKKLRNGYFGVDAELDLHGLSSLEAGRQLQHFLRDTVKEGCECVHIIHGKGYRSENNFPILKNNLNMWLRQHNDVLAFCSASPKDGGTGAVLVLLQVSDKYQ
ncbi:MAG: Smr/MutS family protein [Methylococcales bacterium]|nr:Smr/MutS family protein [Methylococcales bacterium]